MSRPSAIDEISLRARLAYIATTYDTDGSLYLQAIGACYLACDEGSVDEEATLEILFYEQARVEGADGDDVLTQISLSGQVPS